MPETKDPIQRKIERVSDELGLDVLLAVPPEFDRAAVLKGGALFFSATGTEQTTEKRAPDLPADRELSLDLKAEIVRQARATVERIQNVDHLSEAIKADLQRLADSHPEITLEGGAALFAEIYLEAFEEAVALRAEQEEIYRDAANLIAEGADQKALGQKLATLEGKLGLDGTPLKDSFQAAYSREQELFQLLQDKVGRSYGEAPSRNKVGFDIGLELTSLSRDLGFRALLRKQEIKTKLTTLLKEQARGSLSNMSAQSGEGAFMPSSGSGMLPAFGRAFKRYLETSLLPLIIGLALLIKKAIAMLVAWLLRLFKGDKSNPSD